MAFGTSSAVFQEWIKTILTASATSYTGLDSDTVNVALYGNSGTPNKNDTLANTGYGAGQWTSGNQVTSTNWAAAGRPLVSAAVTATSGTIKFDADDTASDGSVTLSNVYGCLVYDDTISGGSVADQGVCFNYFGGAQSVSSGTFTVVWNTSGIFSITV